ncbi:MAG: hypothetical protein DRN15_09365 [Thermoprotei archaeon]|nr:MAG: hypothetical protein DRN15_09365 [Thermoprotei archaeon]
MVRGMNELSERVARIETKVTTICEDVKELKGSIKELGKTVNEEMEVMSRRVTLLENEMASFTVLKKILTFLGGALASSLIAFIFYLLRSVM